MAATVATMSVDATSVVANGAAGDNFLFGSDPMEEEGEDDKDEDGGRGLEEEGVRMCGEYEL